MDALNEKDLLDRGLAKLRKLLPERFELKSSGTERLGTDVGTDDLWTLNEQNSGFTEILVQAKTRFTPRDAERVLGGLPDVVRHSLRHQQILVVAPWLSRRSQELLQQRGINYLDLTGNISVQIERPVIHLQLQGADRDPQPAHRPPARLQGPRVNRLVRLLVDVTPPYRTTELARASGLSQGYVSRLLEALDEQALITRDRRGVITDVDWEDLLVARSDTYDLMKSNDAQTFITPAGAAGLYEQLAAGGEDEFGPFTVTGSFAATVLAPVAAPAQLAVYAIEPEKFRAAAGMYAATSGANVLWLSPADPSQLDRPRIVDGVPHVGPSQLVLDCLGGNGRLPEEGQAVLDWMIRRTEEWRLEELPASPR